MWEYWARYNECICYCTKKNLVKSIKCFLKTLCFRCFWKRWMTEPETRHYWLTETGLLLERQTESFPTSQGSSLHLGLDVVSQLARTRKYLFPVTQTLSSDSFPYLKPYSWLAFTCPNLLNKFLLNLQVFLTLLSQFTHLRQYPGCYSFDRDQTQSSVEVEKLAFLAVVMYQ